MFERRELILKIAGALAAGLVLYELALFVAHFFPLWGVKIPALPSLPSTPATTTSSKGTNAPTAKPPGTNATQQLAGSKATNGLPRATNAIALTTNLTANASNSLARGTNRVSQQTNQLASATNSVTKDTNALATTSSSRGSTNNTTAANTPAAPTGPAMAGPNLGGPPGMPPGMIVMGGSGMPPGMMGIGPGGPGMGKPGPELAPEAQARVDRIVESEILAPVMRPLPMALLGIAGPHVFFRAPNGQTGLIKEGEELGGVKLLRIGINRVLVEEKGEQKELTIFAGIGSDSLMSSNKDSPK
jgi:hypothetical protein